MDPLQPSGPAPGVSPSQTPKIPIEPERMQAIKKAFEFYKYGVYDPLLRWSAYKMRVANQLSNTDVKALASRIGAPASESGLEFINWLDKNGLIHEKTDELNTFIENNFREKEPDEAVQPHPSAVQTKAQRSELIEAAYQKYMDVDPANPENKITAYKTFIDKVNEQMTAQEVKSLVLAFGATATISDFKELTQWLDGNFPFTGTSTLDGTDPSMVKKMMDTIFPRNKL